QAPTLQDMNAALEGFFNNFQDPIRCAQLGDCDLKSTTASQATNPDLKEERSIAANIGTIIQPTKSFSMSLDYWNVSVKDVIGSAFGQALRLEQDFGNAALANYGIQLIREGGAANGEIQRIIYTLENLGTQEAQGMDVAANYLLKTSIGDFNFNNTLVYMFHFYQSFIDVYGREEVVGRQGVPRWRNNFTIGYKKGRWGAQVQARSTADMLETGNISQNLKSIPSPTQFDVNASYDAGDTGRFQLGVINLGNIRPRFNAQQTIDRTLFRRVETIFFTYRNDF
ncbi:MAG: TonB-dependent receptor, partial [Bdellovibrionales bacterium]|nr:TonB-dependent receptor [Bdellovibrionales bacterium]